MIVQAPTGAYAFTATHTLTRIPCINDIDRALFDEAAAAAATAVFVVVVGSPMFRFWLLLFALERDECVFVFVFVFIFMLRVCATFFFSCFLRS